MAGRVAQPPHVRSEEERLATVGAEHFVDAVAEDEAVIEHRHRRVVLAAEPTIDVHHGCHLVRPSRYVSRPA